MPMSEDQGKTYAAFMESQLKAENELRASVNARAAGALTGATGLVTLVIAVLAVLLGKDFKFVGYAKGYVVAAVLLLLASGIFALIAALPWKMKYTDSPTLRKLVNERWTDDETDARNITAYCNLEVLDSLRVGTVVKVKWLIAAGSCQILAVLMLVICVLLMISAVHTA